MRNLRPNLLEVLGTKPLREVAQQSTSMLRGVLRSSLLPEERLDTPSRSKASGDPTRLRVLFLSNRRLPKIARLWQRVPEEGQSPKAHQRKASEHLIRLKCHHGSVSELQGQCFGARKPQRQASERGPGLQAVKVYLAVNILVCHDQLEPKCRKLQGVPLCPLSYAASTAKTAPKIPGM